MYRFNRNRTKDDVVVTSGDVKAFQNRAEAAIEEGRRRVPEPQPDWIPSQAGEHTFGKKPELNITIKA